LIRDGIADMSRAHSHKNQLRVTYLVSYAINKDDPEGPERAGTKRCGEVVRKRGLS
jgi:hypothetical protein